MHTIKNIIKWSLILVGTLAAVFMGLWLLHAPQEFSESSESKARLEKADYPIETMDLEFADLSRATPAMGKFAGDNKRTLKGTLWFPKGDSSGHPLIIYSHGFGGRNKESDHISKHLASNGYIVAAVDFPLSNMRSPAGLPQLMDVINQPGDVSSLIDHVLTMDSDSKSALFQRVDTSNIGAMGLSLGGLTTALATYHPDFKDERITAAVMMAPPLEAFSEQFYAQSPTVNSLLISGSLDRVVPEPANALQVRPRHPTGWFISVDRGTHLGFANVGNQIRWMDNQDDLGCLFMDFMLARLELPERWSHLIPNTQDVLYDSPANPPCPEIEGKSINGLKQQWLARIAIRAFFDMHFHQGTRAESASEFFSGKMLTENPMISLSSPR